MTTPKKIIITSLAVGFMLLSCRDNGYYVDFSLYPGLELNDTTWNNSPTTIIKTDSLIKDFAMPVATESFSASTGGSFVVGSTTKITLPVNAYLQYPSLTPIATSSIIKAEVIAMYKKGDFIRNLKTTSTLAGIGETNAMFRVKLSNTNGDIILKTDSFLRIDYAQPTANSWYKFYYEVANLSNPNNPFYWVAGNVNDGSCFASNNITIFGTNTVTGYEIKSNRTGFLSITKGYTSTSTTRANVVLPVNFTNKNTVVFAVFNTKNIVLRLLPDAVNRNFYFENMPEGESVNFISISYIDGKYYWGDATYTTSRSMAKYKVTPRLNPVPVSEVLGLLNSL